MLPFVNCIAFQLQRNHSPLSEPFTNSSKHLHLAASFKEGAYNRLVLAAASHCLNPSLLGYAVFIFAIIPFQYDVRLQIWDSLRH